MSRYDSHGKSSTSALVSFCISGSVSGMTFVLILCTGQIRKRSQARNQIPMWQCVVDGRTFLVSQGANGFLSELVDFSLSLSLIETGFE